MQLCQAKRPPPLQQELLKVEPSCVSSLARVLHLVHLHPLMEVMKMGTPAALGGCRKRFPLATCFKKNASITKYVDGSTSECFKTMNKF